MSRFPMPNFEKPIIKGINIRIDDSVHELCKVSNETSSHTRGILYFIMLITLLSIIAVLNTHPHNWIGSRIKLERAKLQPGLNSNTYDTTRVKYESFVRSKNENYAVVRLPILGIAFDVNNLAIVSGFTLCFLLIVLRFTVNREYLNLRIAFDAIKARYTDDADLADFDKFIPNNIDSAMKSEWLRQINRKRREHHYNYLSMNEVFNMPPAKASLYTNKYYYGFRDFISKFLFALPLISYLAITLNDLSTINEGARINGWHTNFNLILTAFFLVVLIYLTTKIILNEQRITREYQSFYRLYCKSEVHNHEDRPLYTDATNKGASQKSKEE